MFTALAFSLMVFLSYGFMKGAINNHLVKNTENVFAFGLTNIETSLVESRVTLNILSENVRKMLERGCSRDELQDYISALSGYIQSSEKTTLDANGFYGYFKTLADGPAIYQWY
jgi:hypothetical protein